VVVTHEQKVVGMLSAFDLLQLAESHRYVAKNAPTPSKRKGGKRQQGALENPSFIYLIFTCPINILASESR